MWGDIYYIWHIKDDINQTAQKNILVIQPILFIEVFLREDSWYIVIRRVVYLNGDLKRL